MAAALAALGDDAVDAIALQPLGQNGGGYHGTPRKQVSPILLNLKTKTVMKKTKIVCTIGPKTESEEMLAKMLDAGSGGCSPGCSSGSRRPGTDSPRSCPFRTGGGTRD